MWSQTMMPRAGGSFYGAITVPDRITLKAVANAGNQSNGLLLSNTADAWQSGLYLKTDGSGNPRLTLLAPTGAMGEAIAIDSAAKVGIGIVDPPAQLTAVSALSTRVASIIRGAASQSADLQQWQNNTPTTLASVSSNGSFTAPSLTVSSGGTYTTGSIFADSNWGMIFRSRTASPVNAQYRWANSDDGELMRLDNSGRLIISNGLAGGAQGTAQIEARTVNATTIGSIVRGFGTGGSYTQTADLQQWQSFNGTTDRKSVV
jgi:hypothetical protein